MLGVGGLPRGPYLVGRVLSDTDIPFAAVMDPVVHAERKKPWIRALGTSALKVYEPMIANRTMQLMRVLEEQPGEVNIGDFFNYFSYDIMCDVTYGGGSELLRDGDTDNVWHFIDEALPSSTFLSHVPYLGILCGKLPMFRPAMDRLINFSKSVTAKRLERGSTIKDIFYYLNNEDLPEKDPPPERHLLDDSLLAIVAGSDTTSSALTSLVYCLLTHPSALKNLQIEIDRFYPADADPCDSKHHREMHYLTAVLNENLRLYPPGPTSTQCRVPHGSDDVMLGSYLVPAGTTVMLPPYTLQRDPRHFSPFTEDFWPERWLVATGELPLADALANAPGEADPQTFAHNEAAFIPFSHGPKGCAGKQLGMQELRTVTIALLQKFQLRLRPGWDTKQFDKDFKDYYVTTRPEVPVTLYPRF
ncbi:hypothetical protein BN946_scf184844.g122 [Trametes cinnabarina]|uniref:Cytochrome P450 n=1 Tax=Pycnoporus cinnabarinus TaxID=5643 RepID=A0A060SFD6_PYCCI|nr:hypothetical protein BN946_scf184844.g122 [Trametes cinnabarina]